MFTVEHKMGALVGVAELEVYAEFVHKFRHSPVLSKILGTKILYSSKLWSSQLWTQSKQLRIEAWKNQDFKGVWIRDLAMPVYPQFNI